MKAIILAAGYATRLYPLTKNIPKPLLHVKGKPIIEHIIGKVQEIDEVNEIFVVTNNKFFKHFVAWQTRFQSKVKITVINDQTHSNEDRLGSLGDTKYVVENLNVKEDILLVAGDNLFEFSLPPMINVYKEKRKPVVALYDVKKIELAKLYGIVSIDENNKIIDFEEKPLRPKSTLSSTGIYIYPAEIIPRLQAFVKTHDTDKIGSFLEWLYKQEDIYCYVTEKRWYDIGSLESLEVANSEYGKESAIGKVR